MAKVRQHGTKPELVVRSVAWEMGLRYRLTNRDLPGNPDLANRRRRFAIFVHGCYWHRHRDCPKVTTPKTNTLFWIAKFASNVSRDEVVVRELRAMGYRVVVIWGCQTDSRSVVREALQSLVALPQAIRDSLEKE
jgi:DNA mismatch endonuclease (patch repair protein)